jgi:hypothetical protein
MKKKVFSWIRKLTFCKGQVFLILDSLFMVLGTTPAILGIVGT